jgi:hypothetical protein
MTRTLTIGAAFVAVLVYQAATLINSGSTLPSTCIVGNIYIKTGTGVGFYACLATNTWTQIGGTSGTVTGPGSSTDNAIVRWDGTAGTTIQNSGITIDDANAIAFPDGVRQTFNPDSTNAGWNVGSQAGDPSSLSNGDCWYNSSANKFKCRENGVTVGMISANAVQVGITIDGGSSAYTTGEKGSVQIPITGTITKATLLSTDNAVTTCSTVIDVWKDTYTNYPPTVSDTITASAKPTLSSATKAQDSTLTGWTTSVTAGDILRFKVDSVTGCLRVTLTLTITP